jgi:hypothetical protein
MNMFEELSFRRQRRPFIPFVMVLKDGRRFLMNRPTQFAFSESIVGVFDESDASDPRDRFERFHPSEITAIESPQPVG